MWSGSFFALPEHLGATLEVEYKHLTVNGLEQGVSPADLSIVEEKARPAIPANQNKRTIERVASGPVRRIAWSLALEGYRSAQTTGFAKQLQCSLMHCRPDFPRGENGCAARDAP
jgi:hypothetical protein